MATAQGEAGIAPVMPGGGDVQRTLIESWRLLGRAATFVAILDQPRRLHLGSTRAGPLGSLAGTFFAVIAFRGVVDLVFRRSIPWPSLFGVESRQLREEDVVDRRRVWFWRFWFRLGVIFLRLHRSPG